METDRRRRGRTQPARTDRPARRHAPLLGVAAGAVVLAVLALVACRQVVAASAAAHHVEFATAAVEHVEGDNGTGAVPVAVMLDAPSRSTVRVTLSTRDGTATVADHDYEPVRRRLTFAPGQTVRITTVLVHGDTVPEDYEHFSLVLGDPTDADLGRASETVHVLNDDRPRAVADDVQVGEGGVLAFRPRLTHRYYRPVTATAETVDATATAPADYTAVRRTLVFPAGSTRAVPVGVTTAADAVTEPTETFHLRVRSADLAGVLTATGRIVETQCPSGAPAAAPAPAPAPPSPSSPRASAPPVAVTGSTPWDVVFADDFDDPAATAAHWSTGMRSGARTLADNHELEWYTPANSVLTTDLDGGRPVSVLQQRLTAQPVRGRYYPVGVLSRVYPPARCPQYYDPQHLAPDDASLVPYRFRSGMLNSAEHFAFEFGYVEARVRMPKGFALWPALWLRDWKPWSYELDALEGFDADARTYRGTYWWGNGSHVSTASDGGDLGIDADGSACRASPPLPADTTDAAECSLATTMDLSAGYHTVGLNWTPSRYELYLDGVKRWTSPAGADVASGFNHLILNLAFGNDTDEFDWNRAPVRPLDAGVLGAASFPKPTVEWDYVRVWQPADHHAVCTSGSC